MRMSKQAPGNKQAMTGRAAARKQAPVNAARAAQEAPDSYARAQAAAAMIAARAVVRPRVALVLGTGLGNVADAITEPESIAYADIPHFPRSTVFGHAGRLVLGRLRGVPVAAMQGRFHLYEGYSPQEVVFPVRVLHLLGAEVLVLTNAAGGVAPEYAAGALMLIRDSIALPILAGLNPLAGPNDERFGPRFPALAGAYDAELRRLAREVAQEQGIPLAEGIYAMVAGPSFETPAELRLLRLVGADAVGMSTVPEMVAARHLGMRVLALSCITNKAPLEEAEASAQPMHLHEEVVAQAEAAGPRLARVLEEVVARLSSLLPPA
ncbi:MAG TPA: purine-nucleoside phosphorylase [Ktedonobacterales bacterium]